MSNEQWKKELYTLAHNTNFSALKKVLKQYIPSNSIDSDIALHKIQKAFQTAYKWTEGARAKIKDESQYTQCKLSLFGGLQKLEKLNIDINDVDYWHITNYGATFRVEYQYQALLRAFASSGMLAIPRFEYILKDEEFATEDVEGKITVHYIDKGHPKNITIADLKEGGRYRLYFCLLNIYDNKTKKLIHQIKVQLSPEEINKRKQNSSMKDSGEKVQVWENGRLVDTIKKEESTWEKWTKAQINKTLIKEGFKVLKEYIPHVRELMAFDAIDEECESQKTEPALELSIDEDGVIENMLDILKNPTEELLKEAGELAKEYEITPALLEKNQKIIRNCIDKLKLEKRLDFFRTCISANSTKILSLGEKERQAVINFLENIEPHCN